MFIPRFLDVQERGWFSFYRLVRNYAFEEVGTAIADSLAGTAVKPVLTFGPVR